MDTVRGNIVCLSVSVSRHHMTVFLFIQREYSEHNWGGTSQLLLSKENNRCNGESNTTPAQQTQKQKQSM
ncbi:unnamed protein product [Fusarium graminearum]|uniref:Chromosome 1, complete genome n=1 Tax=Gibberella zeae (strain ATCC MYA-4620 / CBS 123657 / FGSC 9075 / NRRL 31084 / PH-1) TaxID=229533 RepID=A0A098D2Z3_GIBZE|nr:unnamed protein product [Fusarium graminearum]CZS75578.1 unnamed protein product [Fusarium graminearum]